jgi:4-oxalocrotonate tautomerase
MPIIDVKILEDTLTFAQKQALMAELTSAVARVGGEGMRAMTRCVIQEVKSGLWSVAGKPLTTAEAVAAADKNSQSAEGRTT